MENEHEHKHMNEDEIGKKIESWLEHKFSGDHNKDWKCCGHHHKHKRYKNSVGSAVYCIGFFGAVVYYIGIATSFGAGVVGFLKALVWPAFLIHGLLKFLEL